jgi:thiol:disulfide interchange protein DsbG
MRHFILSTISALAIFSSASTFAADPALPPPIKTLVENGAIAKYLGKDQGLDGWVTFKDGVEQYFYVTPDGQGIVMGLLFNARGDALTLRQIEQLRAKEGDAIDKLAGVTPPESSAQNAAPEPAAKTAAPTKQSSAKSTQFFKDISSSNWVSVGDANAPAFYAFIDPQCPHCKDMIKAFGDAGAINKKQIQLRLIPVGLMSEDSLYQAAHLITAPDAAASILKLAYGDTKAVPVNKNLSTLGVQKNLALMQKYKIDVTPFAVYRNKSGEVKIVRGVPKDIKSLIADLK